MTTPEHESFLPAVDILDILHLVFDDVTNTNHVERWEEFASTHPVLAQELRARIYSEARESAEYDKNSEDVRIRMMGTIVFAINALERAAQRTRAQDAHNVKSGDVDGEDQQLST